MEVEQPLLGQRNKKMCTIITCTQFTLPKKINLRGVYNFLNFQKLESKGYEKK
jgi:hypothetical protein